MKITQMPIADQAWCMRLVKDAAPQLRSGPMGSLQGASYIAEAMRLLTPGSPPTVSDQEMVLSIEELILREVGYLVDGNKAALDIKTRELFR